MTVAGTSSTDKVLTYVPTVSGVYYVAVDSSNGTSIGPYILSATPLDDYTGTASTTGRLNIGSSTGGTLEALNDTDLFAVNVMVGLNYQFNVSAVAGFANPTTLDLTLFNSNLTRLAGSSSNDKVVTYTASATATLYLGVTSSNGQGLGSYTLSATPQDDYSGNNGTTGRVIDNSNTTGTLESLNDVDWFGTSLTAGANYQFTLTASSGFINPTTLDISLLDTNGTRVAGFSSVDKSLTYTPTTMGAYYVSVSSSNGTGTGSYTISEGTVSAPVFRFFDTNTGTQFLTASTTERDTVINARPDLKFEGVGLNALASPNQPNATAVFRFFDTVYGTHFFTSSDAERQTIVNTRLDLTFEGTSFYEFSSQQANSTPVYRFFDSNKGTHFFTASAGEKNTIVATRPDLIAEGISFYAPT